MRLSERFFIRVCFDRVYRKAAREVAEMNQGELFLDEILLQQSVELQRVCACVITDVKSVE